MSEGEILVRAALVLGLVATLQKHSSKVTGLVSIACAAVLSTIVVFASEADGTPWRRYVLDGFLVLAASVGANAFGTKLAAAASPKTSVNVSSDGGTVEVLTDPATAATAKTYNDGPALEAKARALYEAHADGGEPLVSWTELGPNERARWTAKAAG